MLNRNRLFRLAGVLVIVSSFVGGWFWMGLTSFADATLETGGESRVYEIRPGMSVWSIANELRDQGVIKNAKYFVWLVRLRGDVRRIQAGEYDVTPKMTVSDLLDNVVNGMVRQYSLTLLEGWTFHQVMDAVNAHGRLSHTLKGLSDGEIMDRLGMAGQHPEGWFFPDTYHFPSGTTDVAFLRRAYDAMRAWLDQEWQNRSVGLPYGNAYEALIMASIVEKETAVPDERGLIAGVFVRRLEKGMRLQTDPTVIYGLGSRYDGNLRRDDLKRDNPYNTYRRKGLTPTPIAMPSGAAIRAALNPVPGEALYFVAKGDGSHHFSATMEEHNRAVRKYQIRNRSREYRSRPDATAMQGEGGSVVP